MSFVATATTKTFSRHPAPTHLIGEAALSVHDIGADWVTFHPLPAAVPSATVPAVSAWHGLHRGGTHDNSYAAIVATPAQPPPLLQRAKPMYLYHSQASRFDYGPDIEICLTELTFYIALHHAADITAAKRLERELLRKWKRVPTKYQDEHEHMLQCMTFQYRLADWLDAQTSHNHHATCRSVVMIHVTEMDPIQECLHFRCTYLRNDKNPSVV